MPPSPTQAALNINIRPFSNRVRWIFSVSVQHFDLSPADAREMAARLLACADLAEKVEAT